VSEALKNTEVYQLGEEECVECMRRMVERHVDLVALFQAKLAAIGAHAPEQALCHECSEVVDIVNGTLNPHHGMSGDGCLENSTPAQIYLHPRVVARIADLETALVFGTLQK
jgi:hypothetical protein